VSKDDSFAFRMRKIWAEALGDRVTLYEMYQEEMKRDRETNILQYLKYSQEMDEDEIDLDNREN